MSTSKWTYVSVGLSFENIWTNNYTSTIWNVDGVYLYSVDWVNSRFNMPAVDSTTSLMLAAQGYYYIKRHRIFNFIKYKDEQNVAISKFSSGSCARIGIQPQCDVCPIETNQCISSCQWN